MYTNILRINESRRGSRVRRVVGGGGGGGWLLRLTDPAAADGFLLALLLLLPPIPHGMVAHRDFLLPVAPV